MAHGCLKAAVSRAVIRGLRTLLKTSAQNANSPLGVLGLAAVSLCGWQPWIRQAAALLKTTHPVRGCPPTHGRSPRGNTGEVVKGRGRQLGTEGSGRGQEGTMHTRHRDADQARWGGWHGSQTIHPGDAVILQMPTNTAPQPDSSPECCPSHEVPQGLTHLCRGLLPFLCSWQHPSHSQQWQCRIRESTQ